MARRRKQAPEPTPDVADFIQGLTASHLECRELGHTWRPWRASQGADRVSWERVLRCSRCRTERVQTLSLRGHVVSNHYVYPDGYTSRGLGRLVGDDRDSLRLESLNRFIQRKGTQ